MSTCERAYQWIWRVMCIIIVVVGGIYYYGILSAVLPNSEDLMTTQQWYLILRGRQPYQHQNIIFDAINCFSVCIGGMSFFSVRLEFTLLYMMILGFSLWLAVSKGERRKRWSVLSLWAFFMIFVHTVQKDRAFGQVYESADWIWQIPYNYHTISLIFALICMIILQSCLDAGTGKKKKEMEFVGLLTGLYAFLFTDLIYYIVFVLPFLIVLLLRGVYHDRTRKYVMPLCCVGVGIILLTRILPITFFERFWEQEAVDVYGNIYGGTDWLNMDHILTCFGNYIKTVMLLFNIEISDRPVISLYSVLFITRIAFVLLGYVIVVKIITCGMKGKAEQSGYTMTDEILAWAFVVLSCSFLFTGNGIERGTIRYYGALVPLLVILLCRNVENTMKRLMPALNSIKYKKYYFAGIIGALCICQAEPVWKYQTEDSYQNECEAVIEYLRMWEAESDGYALAPFWLCTRLSAMTNGDILFFYDEEQIWEIYGEDAPIRYAVVGWNDGILTRHYSIIEGCSNYDEWCEMYKVPIRAVDLDHVYVCEFAE